VSDGTKNASILPALEFLDSRADAARRYQTLEPGNGYYCVAAAAYHAAPLLPAEARRDFLHAIARDWPKRQGRHRTRVRDYRAVLAVCLSRQGLSPAQIGERFGYGREEVLTWIRDGEQKLEEEAQLGVEPRIEAAAEPPPLKELGDTPDPEQARLRRDLMRKMFAPWGGQPRRAERVRAERVAPWWER